MVFVIQTYQISRGLVLLSYEKNERIWEDEGFKF